MGRVAALVCDREVVAEGPALGKEFPLAIATCTASRPSPHDPLSDIALTLQGGGEVAIKRLHVERPFPQRYVPLTRYENSTGPVIWLALPSLGEGVPYSPARSNFGGGYFSLSGADGGWHTTNLRSQGGSVIVEGKAKVGDGLVDADPRVHLDVDYRLVF